MSPDSREQTLIDLAGDAVALIVRGQTEVSARLIDAAPALRVIARSGVGYESVDVAAATRRGIPVVITPDAGAQAVAEGAFAMMLSLTKCLRALDAAVREGRFSERDHADVGDLSGATLGVVGLGRIGRRVAALGLAFGMDVLGHDPVAGPPEGVEAAGLLELFRRSDFVSLHAPLTPSTRGLVDAGLLGQARPGAVLVNLARGALISSLDDLHAALQSGRLAGVGLDVFDPEPPDVSHPLFGDPRVLLSPHALGMSRRAKERIFREMAESIVAVLGGKRPRAVANPEVYDEGDDGSRE